MKRFVLFLGLLFGFTLLYSQNTVGLVSYDEEESYEGYNLLYPHNQGSVFLINNCGEVVQEWPDEEFVPGNVAYLAPDGKLVKCKRLPTSAVNDPIWA
ncbi:MAG: hypothetical protein HKN09_05420, partial [Saprospiraceae bacterium]|nr:hypothetical protein [Saprospiraceae bacterium]